ncbi:MAG: endonuclease V [Caldisericia bacterium]|jgi:deoxyribonuclease V|nr:endonuclease V [Caldisericia bacterium]
MKREEVIKKFLKEEERLKRSFQIKKLEKVPNIIVFLDSSYFNDKIISCFLFYDFINKITLKKKYLLNKVKFPYIPTYLSLREGEFYIKGLKNEKFDLIVVDGQGIAHPRKIGVATYLGLKLNKPSIGIAKNLLYGEYNSLGNKRWDLSFIKDKEGSVLGFALRTRENTKPIFVSIGNLIDIEDILFIIKNLEIKTRIPEPLREVHLYSKELKRRIFENIHNR